MIEKDDILTAATKSIQNSRSFLQESKWKQSNGQNLQIDLQNSKKELQKPLKMRSKSTKTLKTGFQENSNCEIVSKSPFKNDNSSDEDSNGPKFDIKQLFFNERYTKYSSENLASDLEKTKLVKKSKNREKRKETERKLQDLENELEELKSAYNGVLHCCQTDGNGINLLDLEEISNSPVLSSTNRTSDQKTAGTYLVPRTFVKTGRSGWSRVSDTKKDLEEAEKIMMLGLKTTRSLNKQIDSLKSGKRSKMKNAGSQVSFSGECVDELPYECVLAENLTTSLINVAPMKCNNVGRVEVCEAPSHLVIQRLPDDVIRPGLIRQHLPSLNISPRDPAKLACDNVKVSIMDHPPSVALSSLTDSDIDISDRSQKKDEKFSSINLKRPGSITKATPKVSENVKLNQIAKTTEKLDENTEKIEKFACKCPQNAVEMESEDEASEEKIVSLRTVLKNRINTLASQYKQKKALFDKQAISPEKLLEVTQNVKDTALYCKKYAKKEKPPKNSPEQNIKITQEETAKAQKFENEIDKVSSKSSSQESDVYGSDFEDESNLGLSKISIDEVKSSATSEADLKDYGLPKNYSKKSLESIEALESGKSRKMENTSSKNLLDSGNSKSTENSIQSPFENAEFDIERQMKRLGLPRGTKSGTRGHTGSKLSTQEHLKILHGVDMCNNGEKSNLGSKLTTQEYPHDERSTQEHLRRSHSTRKHICNENSPKNYDSDGSFHVDKPSTQKLLGTESSAIDYEEFPHQMRHRGAKPSTQKHFDTESSANDYEESLHQSRRHRGAKPSTQKHLVTESSVHDYEESPHQSRRHRGSAKHCTQKHFYNESSPDLQELHRSGYRSDSKAILKSKNQKFGAYKKCTRKHYVLTESTCDSSDEYQERLNDSKKHSLLSKERTGKHNDISHRTKTHRSSKQTTDRKTSSNDYQEFSGKTHSGSKRSTQKHFDEYSTPREISDPKFRTLEQMTQTDEGCGTMTSGDISVRSPTHKLIDFMAVYGERDALAVLHRRQSVSSSSSDTLHSKELNGACSIGEAPRTANPAGRAVDKREKSTVS